MQTLRKYRTILYAVLVCAGVVLAQGCASSRGYGCETSVNHRTR